MFFSNVSARTILQAAICAPFILTLLIFIFSANTAQAQVQVAIPPLIPIETFEVNIQTKSALIKQKGGAWTCVAFFVSK